MKTPMQELIEKVNQWMLDDEQVLNNPLDYEEYMVIYANQMISVKRKFIGMCESMIEKERYTMGLLMNFILKRYSTELNSTLTGYCFVDPFNVEVTIDEILKNFYNETFKIKE